jgi:hypothetical protein
MPKKYIATIAVYDKNSYQIQNEYELKVDTREEADDYCDNETDGCTLYQVCDVRLNRSDG